MYQTTSGRAKVLSDFNTFSYIIKLVGIVFRLGMLRMKIKLKLRINVTGRLAPINLIEFCVKL